MLEIEDIKTRLASYQPRLSNMDAERQAAVAMILRHGEKGTEVLFIQRAEFKNDPWSGDLGFPGGRIEADDPSPRAAAERETWEEIGYTLTDTNYLGRCDDMAGAFLSVRISCFVYTISADAVFRINGEVVKYFWIPLATLLDPQRNRHMHFFHRGSDRQHPVVHLNEWSSRPLWGITYRLVDNFFNLFDLSFTYPEKL